MEDMLTINRLTFNFIHISPVPRFWGNSAERYRFLYMLEKATFILLFVSCIAFYLHGMSDWDQKRSSISAVKLIKQLITIYFSWPNQLPAFSMYMDNLVWCMDYWLSVGWIWLDVGQALYSITAEQAWSIKDLLYGSREFFFRAGQNA